MVSLTAWQLTVDPESLEILAMYDRGETTRCPVGSANIRLLKTIALSTYPVTITFSLFQLRASMVMYQGSVNHGEQEGQGVPHLSQ